MKLSGKYKTTCMLVLIIISSNVFAQKPKEGGTVQDNKITICHLSNNYTTQSISVSQSALPAHLAHGDIIGACSSENSPLKLSINKMEVSCNGGNDGSIDLNIQFSNGKPPFNFLWSNGAVTEDISDLSAGTYSVTVSISNGLSATLSATINEPDPVNINLTSKNVTCSGMQDGEIYVSPTGGTLPYSFIWSQNAGIQSESNAVNLAQGDYQITVVDAKGCISVAEILIEEPAPLISSFSYGNVLCFGGNDGFINVSSDGGTLPYTYTWSSNVSNLTDRNASNLSSGTYNCTVTDGNGCTNNAEVAIDEPLPVLVSLSAVNRSCALVNDGKATAFASGGTAPYSFLWDLKANSQTQAMAINLDTGTYTVQVSDKNGCSVNAVVTVNKDVCECMLRTEDCGATVVSLAQFIYTNPLAAATNYQWEFSHPQSGFLKTIQRGSNQTNFNLTWVPGIQYGKTYIVRIKPLVNGVWKDYGPACQITVPAPIPYTKIRTADCGLSTSSLNQQLFCDNVAGAQNYQWEFTNNDIGFQKIINRGSNSLSFTLGWVTGIQYGKTYTVRVRANVGGEWGNFGDVCSISLIYPIPVTKVRFTDCGATLVSMTQNIFCDAVAGATDYQWEINNAGLNFSTLYNRNSTGTNIQFGWIAGIQYQTTYDVRVRAKVAGEWAEFGFICQITTPKAPIAPRKGNFNEIEDEPAIAISKHTNNLNVFPNPSNGESIKIIFTGLDDDKNTSLAEISISVEIYDMLGNKVYSRNTNASENNLVAEINNNSELPSGIYILNVIAKNKIYYDRIIIR